MRRQPVKAPRSLWTHIIGAVLAIALTLIAFMVAVEIWGKSNDAKAQQRVELTPLPEQVASDTLNGDGSGLPDLLDGEVAANANPTERPAQRDALGNPVNNDGLAGGDTGASPKTISVGGNGLTAAPIMKSLQKNSPFGPIPTIAADGQKSVKVYARPARVTPGTKPVAIIIGGLGINRTLTQRAINELPADVTLSFAAHAVDLQTQMNQARAKGHEVMLELPMESAIFDAKEPGANRALRVTGSAVKTSNFRNLDWLLSRASGYFGVINYNGDAFLSRSDVVVPILTRLSSTGVGFIFDGSGQAPSLPTLASASALPFAKAHSLLDETPDPASINQALALLRAEALAGSSPIGVGFTYPQTIDAVTAFAADLNDNGLSLVPASAMLQGGS